jgi:hypothetical protein
MMNSGAQGIQGRKPHFYDRVDDYAIWEVTQRLHLYGPTDAQLETLIQQRGGSQRSTRVATEAALYVRHLRNEMARGDSC